MTNPKFIDTRLVPEEAWGTSPFSGGDNCVQYAEFGGARVVRDSKNPGAPGLAFTPGAWSAFCKDVKKGNHDL